ncbi:MAG: glycosyltransferase family 39 protein [Verrucomicrobia bacterium]|nr:glycosyltransferase family 39 protein [Verrucomicrobiota bacterium]
MIRPLLTLIRTAPEPRRVALFATSAAIALVTGFFVVSPAAAKTLITAGGYYYMLGVFALFVGCAVRVAAPRREVWLGWLRRPGWPGVVIVFASGFALWSDPFKHKILFDEYVLQGTALHMHATKEIGTVIRAYDIAGSWVPIDTFLDKRPYFFTFLVSLVHDLTGYRIANMFLVNAALTPLFFGLVYWLGREIAGRGAALLSVGLLATMPLFGQNATGAGMELHNLAMLAFAMVLAVLWLRAPDEDRLSALVLGAILLAQSRYESAIFVLPVACLIVVGWVNAGRVILSWPAVMAPLLLVPRVWHNRFLDASPMLWQLNEGQTSRFGLEYLPGNLTGAWTFFFNFGPSLANSWYLTVLGSVGLAGFLWVAWRWSRSGSRWVLAPGALTVLAFGVGIVGNLGLIMFYYWSRLDDTIASRFALPVYLLFALAAAWFLQWLGGRGLPALRIATVGFGVWLLVWCSPTMAHRLYTSQNLVMQEVEWEHEELLKRPGSVLFISNKSTIPFVLWHIPSIINGVGRQRAAQIGYHMREGTFREVIVAQALRPTSANGEMGVDPEDLMPASYRLEPIAEKRFGGRYARLSRLVAIEEPPSAAKPGAGQ